MSIQANINQSISLMGMLASQTSLAETQRTKARLKAEDKAAIMQADKDIEVYEKVADYGKTPETEGERVVQQEIAEKGKRGYLSKFMLEPTEENLAMAERAADDIAELRAQKIPEEKTSSRAAEKRKAREEAEKAAQVSLEEEQMRIAKTPSFDLDKLAEGPRARVERAYKKAEKDTYYLNKNTGGAN